MATTSHTKPWDGIGDDWEVLPGVTGGELLAQLNGMSTPESARWWVRHCREMTAVTPGLLDNLGLNGTLDSVWEHLALLGEQHPRGPYAGLLTMVQMSGGVERFMDQASGMSLISYWSAGRPSITSPLGVQASEAMWKTKSANVGNLAWSIARCRDVEDALALQCARHLDADDVHMLMSDGPRSADVAREILKAGDNRSQLLADVLCWPAARADEYVRKMAFENLNQIESGGWLGIFNSLEGAADVAFMLESIWGLLSLEARNPSLVYPDVAADFEEYLRDIYRERLTEEVLDILSQSRSGAVRQKAILEVAPRLASPDDAVARAQHGAVASAMGAGAP